ncbi:HAD family hydrolase [Actinomadura violacea]|uniref:HAD family hydrolase n=1 Tax=Actinomadura violacea TaxID=2819934 RepID=A0ABS3RGW3_9ACTN|nr:HAD family hydrolase [Actinomadura violacea]MBO2455968.1 HAD family hydrolase [Actinomadura violacea]
MSRDVGIIWDFDGTLAERPGLWSGCLLEIISDHDPHHGISRSEIAALMHTGFPWHTPERPHPQLCEPNAWWREMTSLLASVLHRLGFSPTTARQLASRVHEHYIDAGIGWRVFPEVRHELQRLRDLQCRQVILSNHSPELPALVGHLGLADYFDAILTSALIGFEKPHPGSYAAARNILPTATDLWMIGDSEEADALGPERNGIRGILLCRNGLHPPQRATRHAVSLRATVDIVLSPTHKPPS